MCSDSKQPPILSVTNHSLFREEPWERYNERERVLSVTEREITRKNTFSRERTCCQETEHVLRRENVFLRERTSSRERRVNERKGTMANMSHANMKFAKLQTIQRNDSVTLQGETIRENLFSQLQKRKVTRENMFSRERTYTDEFCHTFDTAEQSYGVASISRLLKITGLFCRISTLL